MNDKAIIKELEALIAQETSFANKLVELIRDFDWWAGSNEVATPESFKNLPESPHITFERRMRIQAALGKTMTLTGLECLA